MSRLRKSTNNDTQQTATSVQVNQLPVPSMVTDRRAAEHQSSFSVDADKSQRWRIARQLYTMAGEDSPASFWSHSDILVRLLGEQHARRSLHYFLCYLLSSSVTILLCLRLFRVCTRRSNRANVIVQSSAKLSSGNPTASYGFYYRTRLG